MTPELIANKQRLQKIGWLTPTVPGRSIADLRQQYQEQGYLWLKGILPRKRVLAFRRRYFEAFHDFGLIEPGSDPVDGISQPGFTLSNAARELENQIVRWAAFEAFCLQEPIIEFYEAFLGGPVYLHKRKIIRRTLPGSERSTPAHYDLTYLRGGTDNNLCTSWIPIGDIPVEMGGLVYLEGSDAIGREIEAELTVKNAMLSPEEQISAYNKNMMEGGEVSKDLNALADKHGGRWLVANYEAGDMLVHSPYLIHAATTNRDYRMRLSTDIRYQRVDEDIDPRWTQDWNYNDGL